jgi:ACT domain-containing protein
VQDYFNMMMIVDMNDTSMPIQQCVKELEQIGDEIGVSIKCQHEDIFNKMHRI